MAAHTNTSQLLYIIAEKGKKQKKNNKKVTTIKESASVYSGKRTEDSAMSDAISKRLKKSQTSFDLEISEKLTEGFERLKRDISWLSFNLG